jgi:hypothetical protein
VRHCMRSRSRCSGAYEETFIRAAEQARPGEGWKAIVKTYLRPEFCEHPERGCPLAALAPELARADKGMKPQIVAELVNYKNQMLPFMPGRRTVDIKTTWSKSRLSVEVNGQGSVFGCYAASLPLSACIRCLSQQLSSCPSESSAW